MACLSVNDDILAFSCGEKVLALSGNAEKVNILHPPGLMGKSVDKAESDEVKSGQKNSSACVVCVDVSRCNKWLAVCSSNKQLSLWCTSNWSLLSNRDLARTASKVKFTPSGCAVVLADKSGDAYLYSVKNPDSRGDFLFGHLSMLLDVLITDDENYIITCDRDEKIRVSNFPNSYNIQSFCLGHTEFVSCIAMLSHCPSVLVSSSGDGSLRFWNYVNGCQLSMVECHRNASIYHNTEYSLEHIKEQTETSENRSSGQSYINAPLNIPAVTYFCGCVLDHNSSLIAACISTYDGIVVYQVTGNLSNIAANLLEVIFIGVEPWTVALSGMILWCLAAKKKEPLSAFKFSSDSSSFDPVVKSNADKRILNIISLVNNKWELFKNIDIPSLTPILYKRTVDNLQEYQEKKKTRLTSTM